MLHQVLEWNGQRWDVGAEAVESPTKVRASAVASRHSRTTLAAPQAGFGGVEAYPDFETKAAVLCWHLVKNHPLPDGNKRCAFLATEDFVERNGRTWLPAPGDPDATDQVIRAAARPHPAQRGPSDRGVGGCGDCSCRRRRGWDDDRRAQATRR